MERSVSESISWTFPYPSRRMPVMGENVVATSQPLAAQAGLRMLLEGGNAVDAAIAAAVTLTVVEPTGNGIGSDAFALIWDGRKLHGLNGSGRSPRAWDLKRFEGQTKMPQYGWDSVTVPGAVDLWATLWRRFGQLSFTDLFSPAIHYARNGFAVSPITGARWAEALGTYGFFKEFARTFLPGGRAPQPGERFRCPTQADTLEIIADTRGEAFYRGSLSEKIIAEAESSGGAMMLDDLASHRSEWVNPISQQYRGAHLNEIPPNGQGLAALIALGILRRFNLQDFPVDSADGIHLQIEAMKVGFALARRHVGDPDTMDVRAADLLNEEMLDELAREIRLDRAAFQNIGMPLDHGTVYLSAADQTGMMVSLIQSNFTGFGSGVVIPGTGISMQNRGFGFSTKKGHPNCVSGGKRPYHTIIPGFVTFKEKPLMSFGVMGGHMQPQGHVQMMVRLLDYGQNPQTASDAPRWHLCEDLKIALESGFSPEVKKGLRKKGHTLTDSDPVWGYGGAQLILKTEHGYCAASDHRKDGQAVGY
jgi:gamma-glutamyltranspeptidase/glutathione hydrolase